MVGLGEPTGLEEAVTGAAVHYEDLASLLELEVASMKFLTPVPPGRSLRSMPLCGIPESEHDAPI